MSAFDDLDRYSEMDRDELFEEARKHGVATDLMFKISRMIDDFPKYRGKADRLLTEDRQLADYAQKICAATNAMMGVDPAELIKDYDIKEENVKDTLRIVALILQMFEEEEA